MDFKVYVSVDVVGERPLVQILKDRLNKFREFMPDDEKWALAKELSELLKKADKDNHIFKTIADYVV